MTHVWRGLICGRDIHMWDLLTCGRGIHVWDLLTCGRDIHVWDLLTCGGDIHVWRAHSTCGSYSCVEGTFTCGTYSRVEGTFTCGTCVTHVHGNALTCSIPSMVEGSPSHTAHVQLTCTVMPSHVAFPQWWRGAPHIQLMYSSHAR